MMSNICNFLYVGKLSDKKSRLAARVLSFYRCFTWKAFVSYVVVYGKLEQRARENFTFLHTEERNKGWIN